MIYLEKKSTDLIKRRAGLVVYNIMKQFTEYVQKNYQGLEHSHTLRNKNARHLEALMIALYDRWNINHIDFLDSNKELIIERYLLKTVVPHKINVFDEGIKLLNTPDILNLFSVDESIVTENFITQLYYHDLTKFSAQESSAYANHDFSSTEKDEEFNLAWEHHKKNNPYHPEFWNGAEMPNTFILEMIADWVAAGKTYGSTLKEWAPINVPNKNLHPKTLHKVYKILKILGVDIEHENGLKTEEDLKDMMDLYGIVDKIPVEMKSCQETLKDIMEREGKRTLTDEEVSSPTNFNEDFKDINTDPKTEIDKPEDRRKRKNFNRGPLPPFEVDGIMMVDKAYPGAELFSEKSKEIYELKEEIKRLNEQIEVFKIEHVTTDQFINGKLMWNYNATI